MAEALQYLYYFYDKFINFVFNEMEFFSNVTFGWVCITCFVFGILIHNIVRLPYKSKSIQIERGDKE